MPTSQLVLTHSIKPPRQQQLATRVRPPRGPLIWDAARIFDVAHQAHVVIVPCRPEKIKPVLQQRLHQRAERVDVRADVLVELAALLEHVDEPPDWHEHSHINLVIEALDASLPGARVEEARTT